jgi:hypothetical protein
MEVHHHPHVEKKNFKEYFLEFLTIFLGNVIIGKRLENIFLIEINLSLIKNEKWKLLL